MRSLGVALAFLTRVPVPVTVRGDDEVTAAVPWFGIVGLLVGGVVGGVAAALGTVLTPSIAVTLAVVVGLLLTGAFHEDGLADTFDGLAGGYDASRRLEIMRDSRLGTFGAAALVVALLLEVLAGATLGAAVLPWFVVAHGVSRAVATLTMLVSRPARADGLGASYLPGLRASAVVAGAVVVAAAAGLLLAGVVPQLGLIGHLAIWLVPAVSALALRGWSYRAVGGITGDVLGAVQVVGLVGVLLVGSVVEA